jgi:3-hydroxybutyryl-CoA dehydrogenase
MRIVVHTNDELKEELVSQGINSGCTIEWISSTEEFKMHTDADAYMDLLFKDNRERLDILRELNDKPVLINAVVMPDVLTENYIRINGWKTFLKRNIVEAVSLNEKHTAIVVEIFAHFNKIVKWMPNENGFTSVRIVSAIINEAYFSLEEHVSSKEEIDIAMKLGTNYPYGPFEWSKKIGLKNVYELLSSLAKRNIRYEPSALLKTEALTQ